MACKLARHLPFICLFAILFTLACQWNLVSALIARGYAENPILVIESDDEPFYLSLIKESARHPHGEGSPFIKEGRSEQWTYPMLGVRVGGAIMRAFQWDIKTTSIVLDITTTFTIGFLILLLFVKWFEGRFMGYVAALTYLALPSLFGFWRRPVSPQLVFPPLLFTLLVFSFSSWKTYWRQILLGIGGGMLFYTYPFHWTFIIPFFVVDDAWTVWREKRFPSRELIKYGIMLAVAGGALWYTIRLHGNPFYAETMQRVDLLYDHLPTGIHLQIAMILASILWFALQKRLEPSRGWNATLHATDRQIIVGMLTGFIVLNQPLITGLQLEFGGHYQPVILIFLTALIGQVIERSIRYFIPQYAKAACVCLMLIVGLLYAQGIYLHAKESPFLHPGIMNTAEAHEVYAWIATHGTPGSVVAVPYELSHGITLFTDAYLQFSDLQWLLVGPTSDIVERFVYADPKNIALDQRAVDAEYILVGFTHLGPLNKRAPWEHALRRLGVIVPERPRTVPSEIASAIQQREMLTPEVWQEGLLRYGVEYAVFDQDRLWPQPLPGKTVFQNRLYLIQRL